MITGKVTKFRDCGSCGSKVMIETLEGWASQVHPMQNRVKLIRAQNTEMMGIFHSNVIYGGKALQRNISNVCLHLLLPWDFPVYHSKCIFNIKISYL